MQLRHRLTAALLVALFALPAWAQTAPVMVRQSGSDNPFAPISAANTPRQNTSPVLGDLDGDGDLDLIVGDRDAGLYYYRNDPTGYTKITLTWGPIGTSVSGFVRLDLADLDADGDLDLIAGRGAQASMQVLENVGTAQAPSFSGTMSVGSLPNVGGAPMPTLGDLDGDGDLDLLSRAGGTLVYYENTGTAQVGAYTQRTGTANPFDGFTGYLFPRLVDVDGDGDLDVVASGQRVGQLEYLENTGGSASPTFVARTGAANPYDSILIGGTAGNLAPFFADIDGDGDLDLLAGSDPGTLLYFKDERGAPPGSGSGTEPNGGSNAPFTQAPAAQNPFDGFAVGLNPTVALGDTDGDGDLDVVIGRSGAGGEVTFYENTSAGFVRDTSSPYDGIVPGTSGTSASRPILADIDGDGDLDLTIATNAGTIEDWRLINGVLTRRTGAANPFNFYSGGSPVATLGDVDGDGDLDLVVRQGGGVSLRYIENVATPGNTFSGAERMGTANPFDGQTDIVTPHLADVDGDGDMDLVGGLANGTLRYLENITAGGAPQFALRSGALSPFVAAQTGTANVGYPAIGDLDGNPGLELVLGAGNGPITFFVRTAGVPTLSVQLTGAAGWRMVASPDPTATLDQLVNDPLWIQGVPDGDVPSGAPNLVRWDEAAATYTTPTLATTAGQGNGYFVYVYEDDDQTTPGTIDGGFPKVLDVPGPAPLLNEYAFPALSYTAGGAFAGFNLLGNPSASWFDWDAADATGLNATISVYDPAISAYRTYTRGIGAGVPGLEGGVVGPFQAFWAQTQSASAALTVRPAVSNGGPFLGRGVSGPAVLAMRVRPAGGASLPAGIEGGTLIGLGVSGALDGFGPEDAVALTPPASAYVSLSTVVGSDDGPLGLAVDLRPELGSRVEIPVRASVVGAAGAQPLVLDWPRLTDVPDEWTLTLLDTETGASVDLRAAAEYAFTAVGAEALADPLASLTPPSASALAGRGTEARFTLVVQRPNTAGEAGAEASLSLDAPRPNPATSQSDLVFSLDAPGRVRLAVYDVLGREVAVVADGERAAGVSQEALDVSRLAPGVYVVRLVTATGARTRTLTIVR